MKRSPPLSEPVQRGEIYQADLKPAQGSEQDGIRPVLIVSRDAINKFSPVVIIVPVTDASNKSRLYPTHVPFNAGTGGLPMDSVALCEQIRTISKARLKKQYGKVGRPEMASIEAAIKIALDLS